MKKIKQFAHIMRYKFIIHSDKGRFDWKSDDMLVAAMKKEIKELEQALKDGNKEWIVSECADVANYAYMIANKKLRGVK